MISSADLAIPGFSGVWDSVVASVSIIYLHRAYQVWMACSDRSAHGLSGIWIVRTPIRLEKRQHSTNNHIRLEKRQHSTDNHINAMPKCMKMGDRWEY